MAQSPLRVALAQASRGWLFAQNAQLRAIPYRACVVVIILRYTHVCSEEVYHLTYDGPESEHLTSIRSCNLDVPRCVGVSGDLVETCPRFLQDNVQSQWFTDYTKLSASAAIFYGYTFLVGLLVWLVLRYYRSDMRLANMFCIYGKCPVPVQAWIEMGTLLLCL